MILSAMVLGCMQVLYIRLCATNWNGKDDVVEQIAMLLRVFAFKIITITLGCLQIRIIIYFVTE